MGKIGDMLRMTSRERNGLVVLLVVLAIVVGIVALVKSTGDASESIANLETSIAKADSIAKEATVGEDNADGSSAKAKELKKTQKKKTNPKSTSKGSSRDPMSEAPINNKK